MRVVIMADSIKVDLYMDEFVHPWRMHKDPGIIIFSCQADVYKKSDVEYNAKEIMSARSPKLAASKYLLPLASSFSYSVGLEHGRQSWENLSRKVARDISKIYQTCGSVGFEIDKIYPCRNVGEKLENYIKKGPDHVMFGPQILGKIKNDKLDRTYRIREGYDVHYYIKEASGIVAREKSESMMERVMGEISSARKVRRMDRNERTSLFSSIASRYNTESSRIIPTMHLVQPHGLSLQNFVNFAPR